MPRLPLVPLGEFPHALREAVEHGRASGMLSTTVPVQIWAHHPQAAQAWLATLKALHTDSLLDARLRELVRLRIAAITTCQACQLARKSDTVTEEDLACLSADSAHFSARERAALRYAELFAADPTAVDDAVFDALKHGFTVPEIVDLSLYCALMLAGGRMTLVQRAYADAIPMTTE